MLQNSAFGDVWLFHDSVFQIVTVLRTRLIDTYIAKWREGMLLCTSLHLLREFKTVLSGQLI